MHRLEWLYAVGLAVAAAGCGPQDMVLVEEASSSSDEIVGGTTAVITDYPWQVSFQTSSGQHFCGGSVIAAQWVLTAQHCTDGQSASGLRIVAGITKRSLSSSGQIRTISQIIPYPGYTDASNGKDVSLLKLSSPLDLSGAYVKAVPLVTAADASAGMTNTGVMATVTGWGATSSGSSTLPDNLMQVSVPIVSNATAQSAYGQTITADQLAAGYMGTGGKDSCQGDSGGPLVVKDSSNAWKLAGVVSWGNGCADPNYPGMYARVSSFQSWIASQIGGTTPPPTGTLTNGQAVSNLSASTGSWLHYTLAVPAGSTNLVVTISGGTGDADLYVKFGSQPTTSSYDCRPYLSGNAETCTIAAPQTGTYYISLNAYAAFSGVTLKASYTAGGGGGGTGYPGVELTKSSLSGASSTWQHFSVVVPADATKLVAKITGGTGDADLYVRKDYQPTTTSYKCRPYLSGNEETCTITTGVGGTWYVSVRGYTSYSGVTLTADYSK